MRYGLSVDQLTLQILKHQIQCGNAAFCCIPDSRMRQVDEVTVFVDIRAHYQFVFHDIFRKLCPLSANRRITVQYKNVILRMLRYLTP